MDFAPNCMRDFILFFTRRTQSFSYCIHGRSYQRDGKDMNATPPINAPWSSRDYAPQTPDNNVVDTSFSRYTIAALFLRLCLQRVVGQSTGIYFTAAEVASRLRSNIFVFPYSGNQMLFIPCLTSSVCVAGINWRSSMCLCFKGGHQKKLEVDGRSCHRK